MGLQESRVREIVFLGAGDLAEIAYISLQQTDIRLVAVADQARAGERFLGHRILHPERLKALSFDLILVTEAGQDESRSREAIPAGIPADKIISVQEGVAGGGGSYIYGLKPVEKGQ